MRKLQVAIKALSAYEPLARTLPRPSREPEFPSSEAERRQLTVIFVDLVGSTELSRQLDPEDMRDVLRNYQNAVSGEVARYEGHVAKFMGDGVLAYFGWPRAHEDDAERAVRASLDLVETVRKLTTPAGGELAAHIGVATGLVVVGDLLGEGASEEQAVVGETPNLAARLQAIAEPGSVVVSASTCKLLGRLFEVRDLGAVEAKGFDAPVQAWQVVGESSVASRFEAFHSVGITPLVGRKEELELLMRRWRKAQDGEGQVVLLTAEAGIGKSRLVAALQERLQAEPHIRLSYFCSTYHTDSALYPVISQLERVAGIERNDASQAKVDKLQALLAQTPTAAEDVALLAELLSLPTEHLGLATLSPQVKKERTLRALLRQMEGLSLRCPVLIQFEDAHWIDPTSLELLDLLVELIQRLPVLLLLTFRPEFQPPWTAQAHITSLSLARLNRQDTLALIERVAGNNPLPEEIVAEIVERTDGVPLFVEELTKAVLEAGADTGDAMSALSRTSSATLAVPATLHASLMARLDRLGSVTKSIAQIGAVIGRSFSYELLGAVAPHGETAVQDALDQLVGSGLIFERGVPPQSVYTFKHALVQDAAYGTLLRTGRKELHARVAQVLEERFPELTTTQPELLAHHCADGGLTEQAIDYWFAAGKRALRTSANIEAIKHLSQGLQLLTSSLPESPTRSRNEIRFQTALGSTFLATKGWAAIEAAQAYQRADDLCCALGENGERFKIVYGLWMFHTARSEMREARELSDELFRLAEQQNDDELRLEAHHSAWASITWVGEFAASREHAQRGLILYDTARHSGHALIFGGHDPGVCAWAQSGLDLWFLGYPDQAAEHLRNSLLLAEQIAHPPSVAHALNYGVLYYQWRRDEAMVSTWGDRLAKLAAEQSLALHEATAAFARGWLLAKRGQARSSLCELRRGLDGCTELGLRVFEPYFRATIAAVHLSTGEAAVGLEELEETMRLVNKNGQRYWNAELWRLKGLLLEALSPDRELDRAEACYRKALATSRRQQARSLQLRAALSLSRFLRDHNDRAAARDLLAPIYGWFTEGLDTPDIIDGRALLDELGYIRN
jgi:class 3 adenylate cyclase/predicted ATPase